MIMKSFLASLLVLWAVACAEPGGHYGGGHQYHGHYNNGCGADGWYYKDAHSFVMCSNGNAYVQPCAPGSRNSGNYHRGGYYHAHHFCDVNLVDHGYGAHHGYGHGHGHGHGHNRGHGYGGGYGSSHGYHGGHGHHKGYQSNYY